MELKKISEMVIPNEVKFSDISCCEISVCRVRSAKLMTSKRIHAGVVLCAVLCAALCDTDLPQSLTYEQIYNSTHYAQLEYYNTHTAPSGRDSAPRERRHTEARGDQGRWREKDELRGQLLVGFARDPFGQSVPEAEYVKGARSLEPQQRWSERGKRGVVHLYNMLTCATGCDPLAYKGYGCYCGLLGEGRPTDGIDDCCRVHDECYEQFRCPFYTVYFQPYYWKCYHGEPLCAIENHFVRKGVNSCAGPLCECDRRFALCVKRYACPRGKALCRSSPLRLLQNILMSY